MCGLAGIVVFGSDESLACRLDRMVQLQGHRGPDDKGAWCGTVGDAGIGLASARLAILDLTDAGHQPMLSEDGRHVLVYNGEIYNHRELRRELEGLGSRFRSRCDTEVVLRSLMAWGEGALPRFHGMWALAWLDRDKRKMLLARDRMGIKPLYWWRDASQLMFASEIKGVLGGLRGRVGIDRLAVERYLGQSLLDTGSQTFFCGIEGLPPAHFLSLDLTEAGRPSGRPLPYWTMPEL